VGLTFPGVKPPPPPVENLPIVDFEAYDYGHIEAEIEVGG